MYRVRLSAGEASVWLDISSYVWLVNCEYVSFLIHMCDTTNLLHLECHPILISNLKLTGFFSTARGKKDPET